MSEHPATDSPNVYEPVAPEDREDAGAILGQLAGLAAQRAVLAADYSAVENEMHWWVVEAFNQGVSVRPIMDATGLSKSRCYQIRDGRAR